MPRYEYWFVSLSSYDYPYQFLIHYDGETVQAIPWLYGSVYATVAAGVKRGVWIGSEEGLFYSDGQAIEQYLFDAQRLVPLQIDPEKIHFDTLRLRGILGNLGS